MVQLASLLSEPLTRQLGEHLCGFQGKLPLLEKDFGSDT